MSTHTTKWTKSSRSAEGPGGNCVEARVFHGVPQVRDSKNPEQGHLALSEKDYDGLLAAVRNTAA